MAGTRKPAFPAHPKFVPRNLDDLTGEEIAVLLAEQVPVEALREYARQVGVAPEHPPPDPEPEP